MTEITQDTPAAATAAPQGRGAGTWRLSRSGVGTVARLELRQRVRSTRWLIVLVVWALVLGALAALIHHALFSDPLNGLSAGDRSRQAGATMFGLVILLVLSLGALIAPALSATSVNGDRAAGVLATLQTTLLSPAEIVLGKLLAAWLTALALLAVALPFIGWGFFTGGTPWTRLVVSVVLLAVVLLVLCAIGLGWSAVAARTASSAVLTYLSVAFLGLGLPMLFGLMIPVVSTTEQRPVSYMEEVTPGAVAADGSPVMHCVTRVEPSGVTHTERIWWILAANPFVVIADAAPTPAGERDDLLSLTRDGLRELRLGEDRTSGCQEQNGFDDPARRAARDRLSAVWPYGLTADLAVGVGFTVVAVRRLRAPSRRLPRGVRVA